MIESQFNAREQRNRRLAYILFTVSMVVSISICSVILFLVLAPGQGKRLVGQEAAFEVGEVQEVVVKRLELSKVLPNSPQWRDDIVFVIKQTDDSYKAFLGLDPLTGCKINWRPEERHFVDNCSQTNYNLTGRNASNVTTLATRPQHMLELPVETENGAVYVLDQRMQRDIR